MKNVLFVTTLLASAMAFAGDEQLFGQLDTDKSGTLSADEAKADAKLGGEMFAKLDVNQDGQLSTDEFKAMEQESVPPTEDNK
ncbi:MAG: hypothetical protein HYV16_15570 [Gammaproteobacteria bacterium]|nr:hypothetical protein [Gammaproteobacteria bacterium]